ncbi:hypothetical protein FACS18949_09410 [Clostridia bacterium]|nr:hypothetical protein FACS18949_09410 [Clostridia bacterium]
MGENGLVELTLFRDSGQYKNDLFVCVNGKSWQIQRGVTVMVPPCVREVVIRQSEQEHRARELEAAYESNQC